MDNDKLKKEIRYVYGGKWCYSEDRDYREGSFLCKVLGNPEDVLAYAKTLSRFNQGHGDGILLSEEQLEEKLRIEYGKIGMDYASELLNLIRSSSIEVVEGGIDLKDSSRAYLVTRCEIAELEKKLDKLNKQNSSLEDILRKHGCMPNKD